MGTLSPTVLLVGMLLCLLVLVLWVLLPFAVFGSKPLLRALLAEQRLTNERLARLDESLRARRGDG